MTDPPQVADHDVRGTKQKESADGPQKHPRPLVRSVSRVFNGASFGCPLHEIEERAWDRMIMFSMGAEHGNRKWLGYRQEPGKRAWHRKTAHRTRLATTLIGQDAQGDNAVDGPGPTIANAARRGLISALMESFP